MAQNQRVGPILFMTDMLKMALITETKNWKHSYGKYLNEKCAREMDEILEFFDNMTKRLSRPVKDLDDIRSHMGALAEIREGEIRIDMTIQPIEEAYVMLNKYNLTFNDGNAERVDTLAYGWKLLKQQVTHFPHSGNNVPPVCPLDICLSTECLALSSVNFFHFGGKAFSC